MARGWHFTKLSLLSALPLYFPGMCIFIIVPFFFVVSLSFRYVLLLFVCDFALVGAL